MLHILTVNGQKGLIYKPYRSNRPERLILRIKLTENLTLDHPEIP